MEIPGYDRLNTCPITPGCTAKLIFRHKDTGKVYKLDVHNSGMVDHKCTARVSQKPNKVYLGEFYNKRTRKTRFVGPWRLLRSAVKVPKDDTSSPDDWELRNTFEGDITWKTLSD